MESQFYIDYDSKLTEKGSDISRIHLKNNNKESVVIDVHNIFFKFNRPNLNLKIDKKACLDNVDYVNHGKIYNIKKDSTYISFGGLLMRINKIFNDYNIGDDVYCYITFL